MGLCGEQKVCVTKINLAPAHQDVSFVELDLIPFGATLIFSLVLSLEYGIIIGIAINLTFILFESARPKLYFERILLDRHVVYMVRPKSSLYFPSAEYVRQEILRVCCEEKSTVVIDGEFVTTVDGTQSKVNHKLRSVLKKSMMEL